MKVNLKCFSSLSKGGSCDFRISTTYDLKDGQTVEDLIQHAGLSHDDVKIAFINHRKSELDSRLNHGDRVALAPAIGGM